MLKLSRASLSPDEFRLLKLTFESNYSRIIDLAAYLDGCKILTKDPVSSGTDIQQ